MDCTLDFSLLPIILQNSIVSPLKQPYINILPPPCLTPESVSHKCSLLSKYFFSTVVALLWFVGTI